MHGTDGILAVVWLQHQSAKEAKDKILMDREEMEHLGAVLHGSFENNNNSSVGEENTIPMLTSPMQCLLTKQRKSHSSAAYPA